MTLNIQIPNRRLNLGDRILKALGRERLPMMPGVAIDKAYEELGPSAHIAADCEWQGFWSALFNRRLKPRKG